MLSPNDLLVPTMNAYHLINAPPSSEASSKACRRTLEAPLPAGFAQRCGRLKTSQVLRGP